MKANKKIAFIVGTRPEFIKSAAPYLELKKNYPQFETLWVDSGQHPDYLAALYDFFDFKADRSLEISCGKSFEPRHDLAALSAELLKATNDFLAKEIPELIVVQGDTATATQAALAGFYSQIPVAHIEAGLRSHDIYQPFPEELNRSICDKIATLNFAVSPLCMDNLEAERNQARNFLCGNTVYDSLDFCLSKLEPQEKNEEKFVLITSHRRENFAKSQKSLVTAIKETALEIPDYKFKIILHKNPEARKEFMGLKNFVKQNALENIEFLEALSYPDFIALMNAASLIISDSGGIQEEALHLQKALLVLRETNERWQSQSLGMSKALSGDAAQMKQTIKDHLQKPELIFAMLEQMQKKNNPFGTSGASTKIAKHICDFLEAKE